MERLFTQALADLMQATVGQRPSTEQHTPMLKEECQALGKTFGERTPGLDRPPFISLKSKNLPLIGGRG